MGEWRRIISEALDKTLNHFFDELKKTLERVSETAGRMLRATDQRLTEAEYDARQPRLATEADVPTDKKTYKRAEGAVADQAKHGDSCSEKRVDMSPKSSTNFGITAKPPALPRRNDVLVDKSTAAPKPCISPVQMRTITAAGGLLPAGTASTAMRTIFPRPHFSWSLSEETKKRNSLTISLHPAAGGGLFKLNQNKLWSSILAVLQIIYAPARFWEGGARCFVGWFSFGR